MSKSPKFMVFHLKELIYTLIFAVLVICLIVILFIMFTGKDDTDSQTTMYNPGVYSSSISLGDQTMDLKLTVDENHINSVTMDISDDSITTMYPLLEPAFNDVVEQVITKQSTDNIEYKQGSQYTYTLIVNKINELLEDATN